MTSAISVRFEPFVDLYMLLRWEASDRRRSPALPGGFYRAYFDRTDAGPQLPAGAQWDEAVAAMRRAEESARRAGEPHDISVYPDADALVSVDGCIAACRDLAGVERLGGGLVVLPAAIPHLRESVGLAEPLYEPFHERRAHICASAARDLVAPLVRREHELVDFLFRRLGADYHFRVLVHPVGDAPAPIAASWFGTSAGVRPITVDVSRERAGPLAELLLRSMFWTSRSDVVRGPEGALVFGLRRRGAPLDIAFRARSSLVHAHVAEAVRRFVTPEHVDLAESDGTDQTFPAGRAIRRIWRECLREQDDAAETLRAGAVDAICDEVAPMLSGNDPPVSAPP